MSSPSEPELVLPYGLIFKTGPSAYWLSANSSEIISCQLGGKQLNRFSRVLGSGSLQPALDHHVADLAFFATGGSRPDVQTFSGFLAQGRTKSSLPRVP